MAGDASATMTWTVRALLNWTTEYLAKRGNDSARLEAQLLLAHVLNCSRIELIARSDDEPTEQEKSSFRELLRRRAEGCPVAYLLGHREFYLLSFDVTPAVLIPRPDTETLVLEALRFLEPRSSAQVLDLGTGSGCIAISIAHQRKSTHVTAVDLSPDALEVARGNARKHGVDSRMTFLTGDLFAPLPADRTYDLIVSNPPYISQGEFAELAVDVREHEPRLALDGGVDGLAYYRRIANLAPNFLNPEGALQVEIGSSQLDAVTEIFRQTAGLTRVQSLKDRGGRWRVVTARKG
jgi:release factor glutamine methyltransferase